MSHTTHTEVGSMVSLWHYPVNSMSLTLNRIRQRIARSRRLRADSGDSFHAKCSPDRGQVKTNETI